MMLSLHDVTVRFGPTVALDRVTFGIEEATTVALVGPSGCGKSTLLRVIAGLVVPDSGDVSWRGDSLIGVPPERRDVGFLFQDHALFTDRSVADNVGFGLAMRGVDRAQRRRRVAALLDMVGLPGFEDRRVDQLSGGEAQRVAMARALAPDPRLLLLDEPLAALDRARRDELLDELARVLDELGQTAIYVTHDQHEAFTIADRLGVMRAGGIERIDTPARVWSDPESSFVAEFLGHRVATIGGERVSVPIEAVAVAPGPAGGPGPPVGAGSGSGAVTALGRGRVVRCRFAGDRYLVDVALDGEGEGDVALGGGGGGDVGVGVGGGGGGGVGVGGDRWQTWSDRALVVGMAVEVFVDRHRTAPIQR